MKKRTLLFALVGLLLYGCADVDCCMPKAITVDPSSLSFSAYPDEGTAKISCMTSWKVVHNLPGWLHILPMTGSGSGLIQLKVDANTGDAQRQHTVTFMAANGDKVTLAVTQMTMEESVAYRVTYDNNGNGEKVTGMPAPQIKLQDKPLILSDAAPERLGYTFAGWITQVDREGDFYSPGDTYIRNADVTLYALWSSLPYYLITVHHDGHGKASANWLRAVQGTTITVTATPNAGYRFQQWEVERGALTLSDPTSTTATFIMPEEEVLIKALFEEIPFYTITVHNDGNGSADSDLESALEGTTVTVTAIPNAEYRFKQWEVEVGAVVLSSATDNPATFTMPSEEVSVKALFEVIPTYTITYNANGNDVTDMPAPTFQIKFHEVDLDLSTATPDRFGYTFTGWNTQDDGAGDSYNPGATYNSDADLTLFAQWTRLPTVMLTMNIDVEALVSTRAVVAIPFSLEGSGVAFVKWGNETPVQINLPYYEGRFAGSTGSTSTVTIVGTDIYRFNCSGWMSPYITALEFIGCSDLYELSCFGCPNLRSLTLTGCTALNTLFCYNCGLDAAMLDGVFTSLPVTQGQISIAANPGTGSCNKTIAELKGWTVNDV